MFKNAITSSKQGWHPPIYSTGLETTVHISACHVDFMLEGNRKHFHMNASYLLSQEVKDLGWLCHCVSLTMQCWHGPCGNSEIINSQTIALSHTPINTPTIYVAQGCRANQQQFSRLTAKLPVSVFQVQSTG